MENPIVQQINKTAVAALHPYFPLGVAIPGYAANTMGPILLVTFFGAGCSLIFLSTLFIVQQTRPGLAKSETATAMWFVLCGFIHLFFEGYFSVNHLDMASQNDLFGQLWKEYSLSDSRYLTQDGFLVCMETITAFTWGPLSFLCAYCIIKDLPLRHPLTVVISLGQIYGDLLYFGTCYFNELVYEIVYCRPEDFYFWAYYFFCNFIWIVIPGYLFFSSVSTIVGAFQRLKAIEMAGKKDL